MWLRLIGAGAIRFWDQTPRALSSTWHDPLDEKGAEQPGLPPSPPLPPPNSYPCRLCNYIYIKGQPIPINGTTLPSSATAVMVVYNLAARSSCARWQNQKKKKKKKKRHFPFVVSVPKGISARAKFHGLHVLSLFRLSPARTLRAHRYPSMGGALLLSEVSLHEELNISPETREPRPTSPTSRQLAHRSPIPTLLLFRGEHIYTTLVCILRTICMYILYIFTCTGGNRGNL